MKRLLVVACLMLTTVALAEPVDLVSSPKPQQFVNGAYMGAGTPAGQATSTYGLYVFGDAGIGGNLTITGTLAEGTSVNNGDHTVNGDAGFSNNVTISNILTLSGTGANLVDTSGDAGFNNVMAVYITGGQEEPLISLPASALSAALKLGGYGLPGTYNDGGYTARAFTLQAIEGYVTTNSGGGAANTVITATDATNTCTFTIPCNVAPPGGSATSAGIIRLAAVNGSGTGCVYPAGAAITVSVTTAGCTTTQPTITGGALVGVWQ